MTLSASGTRRNDRGRRCIPVRSPVANHPRLLGEFAVVSPAMIQQYTLRLIGIRFRANVGASTSERAIPQELVVDVELTLPVAALPRRDHQQEISVSYDTVTTLVVEEGMASQHRLLETYTQRLVKRLLEETPALKVRVAATKLRVPTRHSVDRAVVELTATRDV